MTPQSLRRAAVGDDVQGGRREQACRAGAAQVGGGKGAHVHGLDKHAAQRGVRRAVDGLGELPHRLAQAKHEAALALALQLLHGEVEEVPLLRGALELAPALHRGHADGERGHGVEDVADGDEEDEDVDLVDEGG